MIIIEVAQAVQYVCFLPLSLALRGNGVSGVAKGFVGTLSQRDDAKDPPHPPPHPTPFGHQAHYWVALVTVSIPLLILEGGRIFTLRIFVSSRAHHRWVPGWVALAKEKCVAMLMWRCKLREVQGISQFLYNGNGKSLETLWYVIICVCACKCVCAVTLLLNVSDWLFFFFPSSVTKLKSLGWLVLVHRSKIRCWRYDGGIEKICVAEIK